MNGTEDPFWTMGDTEALKMGPVVTAQYDGECALEECTADIFEGDDIRSDGAGGWVHADCADGVA